MVWQRVEKSRFFFDKCYLEFLGATKGGLFCLGGYSKKSFNRESFKKEIRVFGKHIFPLSFR